MVVIADFGVTEDAAGAAIPPPFAKCAQVPTNATALQALQKVTDVRTKTSSFGPLLCAIGGFPASGCADTVVQTATPPDSGFLTLAADQPAAAKGSGHTGLYVGLGVLVAVLLAAGLYVARRNRAVA